MFAQFVARQLGHPSGLIGRWLLGPLWNRRNRPLNDVSLAQLALRVDDRVLEVGFGGGYLLRRMSAVVTDGFISGVDISATLVEQGQARYRALIQAGRMDLKVGATAAVWCCALRTGPACSRKTLPAMA
jgi:SAM-dependent methyltransferase